jgi:tetratricopeptide (TPR) repeat protein
MSRSLNPYIAGNPVGNSNAFIGRADIVRDVLHIFSRPEENAIVLYGQRRIGKTSVLQFLQKTLAQETATGHYYPVYFDLQDKATLALGDVLTELAATIANALNLEKPQLGDNPAHSFQYDWLPQQLDQLPENSALVLLFDEFDVLAADSAKDAGGNFFPYLRQLLASDRQRLNFVFVIGRNISDLNNIALSLFKGISARRVSLLDKADTFALIKLSEQTTPLRWSTAALERIWQLTNGHAFFTQQLCSFAWEEAYNDGEFTEPEINDSIVNNVLDEALDSSRHALEWLWAGLPPAERVVSSALAQVGGRAVTEAELEKLLHDSGVRIVIRELKNAPKLLQDWDLLEPTDGGFRFRVELLRQWIEENKPLGRVQDELDRIEPVAENLFQAAQGLYKTSQLEAAENLLRQAIGLNPNHVKANKLLADLLLANGKYAEAQSLLASLYEYQPIEARSRLVQAWLGLASLATDEQEKLGCYEAILNIDPNQTEAIKAYKAIWEAIGDRALEQERLTEAVTAYQKAGRNEKITIANKKIHDTEAKQYLEKLNLLERKKKYKEAIDLINKLAMDFPQLCDWDKEQAKIENSIITQNYYQQALDLLKIGDNEQAQKFLVKVITINPEFEDAARYLLLTITNIDYNHLCDDNKSLSKENHLLHEQIDRHQTEIKKLVTEKENLLFEKNKISEKINYYRLAAEKNNTTNEKKPILSLSSLINIFIFCWCSFAILIMFSIHPLLGAIISMHPVIRLLPPRYKKTKAINIISHILKLVFILAMVSSAMAILAMILSNKTNL